MLDPNFLSFSLDTREVILEQWATKPGSPVETLDFPKFSVWQNKPSKSEAKVSDSSLDW